MLEFGDFDWTKLDGGYRQPFDPRPLLRELAIGDGLNATWEALWDELHHQGDVGAASFAAVPHIVDIYRSRGATDWNAYAIVAIIELARGVNKNPDVPDWLKEDYFSAIRDLAEAGASEILRCDDTDTNRMILSVLALERGLRTLARLLVNYSDDELSELASNL